MLIFYTLILSQQHIRHLATVIIHVMIMLKWILLLCRLRYIIKRLLDLVVVHDIGVILIKIVIIMCCGNVVLLAIANGRITLS